MSNIDRGSFLELTTASFPDGVETAVTLARPVTPLPALSNNKDHVIEPMARDEFRAGKAITILPATLELVTVLVRKVELVRGDEGEAPNSPNSGGSPQGTNVIGVDEVGPTPGALYPNGSLGVGEPEVLFEDAAGLPLGGTAAPTDGSNIDSVHKLLQNIHVSAHQSVRLTLFNGSGGALNGQVIETTYDTGLHAGNYSLQS
jgi:hypothetical protein